MGSRYEFKCPGCGYRAEVGGGVDYGFRAVVVTVSCADCGELFDAAARESAPELCSGGGTPSGYECPNGVDL